MEKLIIRYRIIITESYWKMEKKKNFIRMVCFNVLIFSNEIQSIKILIISINF